MVRMAYVQEDGDAVSSEAQAAFARWEDVFPGQIINLVRIMANDPPLLELFAEMNRVIYTKPRLTPAEVELAYTTATVVNECHYWIPTHTVTGRVAKLTEQQLKHLGDEPLPDGVYSARELAIVRYSQQVTHEPPRVSEDVYLALTEHFDRAQILQICFIVGLSAMVNRFHATFLTDVDTGTMEMLDGTACPIPLPPLPGARTAPWRRRARRGTALPAYTQSLQLG